MCPSDRSKMRGAEIRKRPCRNILSWRVVNFIYVYTHWVSEKPRNGSDDIVYCTCRSMVAGSICHVGPLFGRQPGREAQSAVKQALSLAGGTGNSPNALVGNVTDSNVAPLGFSHLLVSIILSPSRSRAVSFESIAGAAKVDINDIFLTFHNALLHVARFPAESQTQSFSSTSSSGNLHMHMQQTRVGCQESQG